MVDNTQASVDEAYDARIGRNVRDIREARQLTQTDLAARMTAQGLPFRQQTLVKIENGSRPLRLREAHEIADALNVDVGLLVVEGPGMDESAKLIALSAAFQAKWEALVEAVRVAMEARADLAQALDAAGGNEAVDEWVLNEAQTMLQVDLANIAAEAVDEATRNERSRQESKELVTRYERPAKRG